MLTVREALEMPVFHPAQVVAGREGLDNQIRWVHIVDIPDASFEWRRRGVLLLTAGFGLQGSPDRQATLVPKLVAEGFAGMVLSVGYYFQRTPDVIRQDADRLHFPVVETPHDLLFIEITEAVLERIINRQYHLLQQSTAISEELTGLVLQGAALSDLARTLAQLLRRSVTIEDTGFHILAEAQEGPVDDARERSLANGRTTPEVAQHLLDEGIYRQLLADMKPRRVRPMPALGMTMERVVAPIIVDREIYGYIWIIAGQTALTGLDELAIQHGATVAALILFKEQAVREAEEAVRGDFLERLLRGGLPTPELLQQAQRLAYRLDHGHQVLLVRDLAEAGGNIPRLSQHVEAWLETRSTAALVVRREQQLVLVIESAGVADGEAMAADLVAALSHPSQRLLIGVGGVCLPRQESLPNLEGVYREAQEALRIGGRLGRTEGVVSFARLGLLHWLYHLPPEVRAGNRFLQTIRDLAAYDARKGADLVTSLETYLERGGSLVETAAALHIHRNTLLHRLERIESLTGLDLRQPDNHLNLYAAVKSYRLNP